MSSHTIRLPIAKIDADLDSAIRLRASTKNWDGKPISLAELSNILFYSYGVTRKAKNPDLHKRVQASAGGFYPLQIYIFNYIGGELKEGVYRYNTEEHSLEMLDITNPLTVETIKSFYFEEWPQQAACGVMITAIPKRVVDKYGPRGYRYAQFEAGGVIQTMNVIADIQGIGCVAVGGTQDKAIEEILCIDGKDEFFMIGLVLGKKTSLPR